MAIHSSDQGWQTAIRSTLTLSVIMGLIFPLAVVSLAQVFFPSQANGSLVKQGQKLVGSTLVAQPFMGDRYFHGRPSAANDDPTAASGSNEAPSNPELRKQVAQRASIIEARDRVPASRIPVDLVTASGSGIDPDISPAAAYLQVARVAEARGLTENSVQALVKSHIQTPQWGLFGQPRVNVLTLNMALNRLGTPGQ